MKIKTASLVLAAIVSTTIAAHAQFTEKLEPQRDQTIIQGLVTEMPQLEGTRGGQKKALGLYGYPPSDIEFKSGYKDLDPQTIATWAYDLHTFIHHKGGGWEKCQGDPNKYDDSMVPYKEQYDFAKVYWNSHSGKYKESGFVWKDWWANDAVLDGNDLYMHYQRDNAGLAQEYLNGAMERLVKKK